MFCKPPCKHANSENKKLFAGSLLAGELGRFAGKQLNTIINKASNLLSRLKNNRYQKPHRNYAKLVGPAFSRRFLLFCLVVVILLSN